MAMVHEELHSLRRAFVRSLDLALAMLLVWNSVTWLAGKFRESSEHSLLHWCRSMFTGGHKARRFGVAGCFRRKEFLNKHGSS